MSKNFLFFLCLYCLYALGGFTQLPDQLDGKWSFTGLRTTVFKTQDSKLYVGMIEYGDTANFSRFLSGLPVDSAAFVEAVVEQQKDSIIINASFPAIAHELRLVYASGSPDRIWFTGDVYFDSARVITTNANCTVKNPGCVNRLYNKNDLISITGLKSSEKFLRDDAFEFLLRLNEKLKSKCNRCYAGFTDAYMNEVLIEMGFNPISVRTANKSAWYNTSGFTVFLKEKYAADQRIVKLIDYVFDSYLK
ncbi:MAG: hypothetical protein JNK79_18890 [Chitinophagaceae bacterium]|nr:hypothetical protein [Chitinophagaceae bacterium]